MKIGLVLHKTPAKSEEFLISKIKGLMQNGHEVILFAYKDYNFELCEVVGSMKISNIFIFQVLKMLISYVIIIIKSPLVVYRYLNLEKLDGVSFRVRWENLYLNSKILGKKLHWIHFCFATTVFRKENVAKAINAKMGVSLRGYDINVYPLKNPNCYDLLWEKVDKVHSISYSLLEKAKSLNLENNNKQIIIYPAVNKDYFINNKSLKDLSSKNKIEILSVARLHWIKGLEYTIQALAKLKDTNFNYTIIGSGAEYDRILLTINYFDLTDRVKILSHVPHSGLKNFYKKADFYLQYSLEEGFCNSVLEAQSMGLLTIVSDASGLKENVIHGKTGWVVPKREPNLLAKKIQDIIRMDFAELNKIRSAGQDRARNNFDIKIQNDQFNIFFNEDIF